MKDIVDDELEIEIVNKKASYDINRDSLTCCWLTVTCNRKNGYLVFDSHNRNIGIVYMADDLRAYRYGNAEILFYKKYKNEFGTWRVIKLKGNYLPFERLESILEKSEYLKVITDRRIR